MVELSLSPELYGNLIDGLLHGILIFGNVILRRAQIIPAELRILGLIKEYLLVILFPMDPVRNIITQFVEIMLAKNRDSQMDSALRAIYDGSGYWVDAAPRRRQANWIMKKSIVGYGSPLKNRILTPFHKHNIQIPPDCTSVVNITKEDIPLLLKHKFTITQSRITNDTTMVTKACYILFTLYWTLRISGHAYYLWTVGNIPPNFPSARMFVGSIVVPLFYPFGKCIAPVFVSLQSDESFLKKDFINLAENKGPSDDVIPNKVSNTKESVQRDVHVGYELERAIGSLIYLVLYILVALLYRRIGKYDFKVIHLDIGTLLEPTHLGSLIFTVRILEAGVHLANCLTKLAGAYFTNRYFSKLWSLWSFILSVIYFVTRFLNVIVGL